MAINYNKAARTEAAELLQNFLQKGVIPLFKEKKPSNQTIEKAYTLFETGVESHGYLYPVNLLWSREAMFTKYGLSLSSFEANLGWSENLLKIFYYETGWENLEQQFCNTFGGYSYVPQDNYPPSLSGLVTAIENINNKVSHPFGFATHLPSLMPASFQTPASFALSQPKLQKKDSTSKLLSNNQKDALLKLEQAYNIFYAKKSIGGITIRSPLLIGASGGGKTTVVRALAHSKNTSYMLLDGADWILSGAAEPQTLASVLEFVRTHEKGIIAIDECDKLGNAADDGHAWWKSVRGEIMAVIEKRADNWAGWGTEDKEKFKNNFFVVGLGTWQHLFRKKTSMGFLSKVPTEVNYNELKKDASIPEELLARFGRPILLTPLTHADFVSILSRLHAEIGKTNESLNELAQTATESEKEFRWVEDYVTDLLFSRPTPAPPGNKKATQIVPPRSKKKIAEILGPEKGAASPSLNKLQ